MTEFAVPTPNVRPYRITVGPDGNLWFGELAGGRLGRITPSGALTEFTLPDPASRPIGLVSGPDRSLWLVEQGRNKIARVSVRALI
jgi:virginiamycin B lyase